MKRAKVKVKMLETHASTHLKIKAQSAMREMTMRDYIEWLADQDKKAIMKGK